MATPCELVRLSPGLVTRRTRAGVSLTPLIDVVFILLVFFMLASSFARERAIALDTTTSAGAATSSQAERHELWVGPSWFYLDGESLDLDGLATRLASLDTSVNPAVSVQPVDGVRLQRIVDALDALDAARIDAVSLANPAETSGRGTPPPAEQR